MPQSSSDDARLSRQVSTLIGGAPCKVSKRRDWQSATFCGHRLELTIALKDADAVNRAREFKACLSDQNFALIDHFVADILVTAIDQKSDNYVDILIEALLLES